LRSNTLPLLGDEKKKRIGKTEVEKKVVRNSSTISYNYRSTEENMFRPIAVCIGSASRYGRGFHVLELAIGNINLTRRC